MTLEEAERILDDCDEYIADVYSDTVLLDGIFTVLQLEAVITVMRATPPPS